MSLYVPAVDSAGASPSQVLKLVLRNQRLETRLGDRGTGTADGEAIPSAGGDPHRRRVLALKEGGSLRGEDYSDHARVTKVRCPRGLATAPNSECWHGKKKSGRYDQVSTCRVWNGNWARRANEGLRNEGQGVSSRSPTINIAGRWPRHLPPSEPGRSRPHVVRPGPPRRRPAEGSNRPAQPEPLR